MLGNIESSFYDSFYHFQGVYICRIFSNYLVDNYEHITHLNKVSLKRFNFYEKYPSDHHVF